MNSNSNDPMLAPSNDGPNQTTKKVNSGRGIILFIGGVAAVAFGLYLFIVVYGIVKSS